MRDAKALKTVADEEVAKLVAQYGGELQAVYNKAESL